MNVATPFGEETMIKWIIRAKPFQIEDNKTMTIPEEVLAKPLPNR